MEAWQNEIFSPVALSGAASAASFGLKFLHTLTADQRCGREYDRWSSLSAPSVLAAPPTCDLTMMEEMHASRALSCRACGSGRGMGGQQAAGVGAVD